MQEEGSRGTLLEESLRGFPPYEDALHGGFFPAFQSSCLSRVVIVLLWSCFISLLSLFFFIVLSCCFFMLMLMFCFVLLLLHRLQLLILVLPL